MGRVLSGAAFAVVILVGLAIWNGAVDISGLDPRRLFEPDYTTMHQTGDCFEVAGGVLSDEYDECVRSHASQWEKAKATVRERGFNDGRKHSCDALRGRYVSPDAAATAQSAYESADLRAMYQEGYNEGSFSVLILGNC